MAESKHDDLADGAAQWPAVKSPTSETEPPGPGGTTAKAGKTGNPGQTRISPEHHRPAPDGARPTRGNTTGQSPRAVQNLTPRRPAKCQTTDARATGGTNHSIGSSTSAGPAITWRAPPHRLGRRRRSFPISPRRKNRRKRNMPQTPR